MKSSKKYIEHLAKSLFKKSLTNGSVDDKKVKLILKEISSKKPAGLSSILKNYKRLVVNKISQEEVIIESSIKLVEQKKLTDEIKKKTGAKRVVSKTNPNITVGTRIIHGDWIWDDTLEGKLKQLTNQ